MFRSIPELINFLCDKTQDHQFGCDISSSSIHMVSVPIPVDLYHHLLIMSSELKKDSCCLGGDLLTLAVLQAFECFPPEEQDRLRKSEEFIARQEALKTMEDCKYDWGGP